MRQHALTGEEAVERLVQRADQAHDLSLELPVDQQPVFVVQVESGHRGAQKGAERARAHRQPFRLEGRASGHHAKTLTQQEQGQAVAHLGTAGDLAQQHVLLELDIRHQAELAEGHAGVVAGQWTALRRVLQGRQSTFQGNEEARDHIGATALDLTQRLETGGLDVAAAGLVGELEQLLLGFVERELEATLELVGAELQHAFQQLTHAPRQGPLRQPHAVAGIDGRKAGAQHRCAPRSCGLVREEGTWVRRGPPINEYMRGRNPWPSPPSSRVARAGR